MKARPCDEMGFKLMLGRKGGLLSCFCLIHAETNRAGQAGAEVAGGKKL